MNAAGPLLSLMKRAHIARLPLIAAGAMMLLSAAVSPLPAILTGRIIDALQHRNTAGVLLEVTRYALLSIGVAAASAASGYLSSFVRETFASRMRQTVFQRLIRARLSAIERLNFGQLSMRLNEDIDNISMRLETSFLPSLSALLSLLSTAVVMFAMDARFAAIAILAVSLGMIPSRVTAGPFTKAARQTAACSDDVAGNVAEIATVGALAIVRHPKAAARERERYAAVTERLRGLRMRQAAIAAYSSVASSGVSLIGPVATLGYGAYMLLHGESSIGTVIAFLLFQGRLGSPFSALSLLPLQIRSLNVISERILEVCDLEQEQGGTAAAQGTLNVQDVSFDRGGRRILHDVNLSLRAGEHVAIVGPSGSGKSTIALLATRLYDPNEGSFTLGASQYTDVALDALRSHVVAATQDPLIFDASFRDNLTYLNPNATEDDIAAVIAACALEPVAHDAQQREGQDLGHQGFRLSGGERQRLCVARALLAHPSVLVLDEALTGVDAKVEAAVLAAVRSAMIGRSIICITHRLHSAAQFDRVIVVRDGRIYADGPHTAVYAADDWYRQAYDLNTLNGVLLP